MLLFHPRVRPARAARARFPFFPTALPEALEPRRLLSAQTTVTEESYLGGVQLRVTGTDGDDLITVRSDPTLGLVVTNALDGSFTAYGGSVKTIRVDGGPGDDSILIDGTVSQRAFLYGGDGDDVLIGGPSDDYLSGGTGDNALEGAGGDDVLVTVGGGVADRLKGGDGRDSFWLDARRTETVTDLSPDEAAAGAVHRVGSFFSRTRDPLARSALGNVALNGADLADPVVSDTRFAYSNFADRPLFGDAGPRADDVAQGSVGDCYFMVVLSSTAALDPTRMRESIADLGDGTYAVQFRRGSSRFYVRVDADLPVVPNSSDVTAYASLGAQESLWPALAEKAFAVVRTASAGYAGLDGGWMRETYGLFGARSRSFWTASSDLLMRTIQSLLSSGRSVTIGTTDRPQPGSPLLASHAYSVESVIADGAGTLVSLRLRNPWGVDGAGAATDGVDDGYITVTAQQLEASLAGVVTAHV